MGKLDKTGKHELDQMLSGQRDRAYAWGIGAASLWARFKDKEEAVCVEGGGGVFWARGRSAKALGWK